MDGMDDDTGPQEEQGLEEGVGEEMELGSHVAQSGLSALSGYAQGEHHETDLGHGRIGEHPFNIRLCGGDDRCKKRGEYTKAGDPG